MAEYIEREAAIATACKGCNKDFPNEPCEPADCAIQQGLFNIPADDVVEIPQSGIGDLSDGYHTFNELYHHRAILFSVICNANPNKAWKSKLHDTGDMYDGMFIVGIETPNGQATYHYDIDPYWDMFKVKELEKAPKWDGHTPQEAIGRISALKSDVVEVVRCKDCHYKHNMIGDRYGYCIKHNTHIYDDDFCSYGCAKMDGKGEGE